MRPFARPELVIVRDVAPSFAECLRSDAGARIDVVAARRQHAAYVAVVRDLGLRVETLPSDDACPDCCFVEDTAVVFDDHAVITRPGADSRRAETPVVALSLENVRKVHAMAAPASLDGGDVLRAEQRLFVGLSSRTNRAGVEELARVAALDGVEVTTLEVGAGLHLKSACALASADLLVYDPRALEARHASVFTGAGLELVEAEEPAGANVLALGASVLVSAVAPRTADRLAARGLDVRVVDVGEFHKGDGALTCLSLRVAAAGAWCT